MHSGTKNAEELNLNVPGKIYPEKGPRCESSILQIPTILIFPNNIPDNGCQNYMIFPTNPIGKNQMLSAKSNDRSSRLKLSFLMNLFVIIKLTVIIIVYHFFVFAKLNDINAFKNQKQMMKG